jgi:predicted DNA-binding transcriptional regulator AlpA
LRGAIFDPRDDGLLPNAMAYDAKRKEASHMARRKGATKDGERLLGVHVAKKTSHVPVQEEARPPPMADELLDIDDVCRFFGGSKPLHPATIYRGLGRRFPRPIKVGPNSNRWLKSECEAALREMAAERAA